MLWSLICYKLGIPDNMSIAFTPAPPYKDYIVFDCDVLEEYESIAHRDDLMNTAFCYLEDDDYSSMDTDDERLLDQDYD